MPDTVAKTPAVKTARTGRNVGFVVLGVAALVTKPLYHGPLAQAVHAWGGNFAVSFAVYFLALIAAPRLAMGRLAAAASALLAVEAFELTNGFGVMSNVYDPLDLAANAAGVGAALLVDLAIGPPAGRRAQA